MVVSDCNFFSRVRGVTRSLDLYVLFVDRCCPFVIFFGQLCSVLSRFTNFDYPFGIFKLFIMTIWLKIVVKTMNVCKILLSLDRPLVEHDLRTHSEHFISRHVLLLYSFC